MPQLMRLLIALISFFSLATSNPTYPANAVPMARDVISEREPPCLCYDGTPIGFYCGFEIDNSPGHLTGTCNPNNAYACGGGPHPMYFLDCPLQGKSCKNGAINGRGGFGTDFCG